jgi:hypothetical protein
MEALVEDVKHEYFGLQRFQRADRMLPSALNISDPPLRAVPMRWLRRARLLTVSSSTRQPRWPGRHHPPQPDPVSTRNYTAAMISEIHQKAHLANNLANEHNHRFLLSRHDIPRSRSSLGRVVHRSLWRPHPMRRRICHWGSRL